MVVGGSSSVALTSKITLDSVVVVLLVVVVEIVC